MSSPREPGGWLRCFRGIDTLTAKVLAVGGYERFWVKRGYEGKARLRITLLNLHEEPTHDPNMRSVLGTPAT